MSEDLFGSLAFALPETAELFECVENRRLPAGAVGLPAAGKALVISALLKKAGAGALVLVPDRASARNLAADLDFFGVKTEIFPEKVFSFRTDVPRSRDYERERLRILCGLGRDEKTVVIATPAAAAGFTVPPGELSARTLFCKVGGTA
nr:hypothetical protein [Clostridia bacterium]